MTNAARKESDLTRSLEKRGHFGLRRARNAGAFVSQLGVKLLSMAADARGSASRSKKRSMRVKGQRASPLDMACCYLAKPDTECPYTNDKAGYTCPDGYYKQWWFCCQGTRQVGCGECTKSTSTCSELPVRDDNYACSIWWYTGASC
jgi:hypothetical protein